MCIKISNFLFALAPLMIIQKGIISQIVLYEEQSAGRFYEETKNVIVKHVDASIGKYATLICPDLNGTAQYTWLKNNESLKDSENIKVLDNGQELRLLVTSNSTESNYTCKCVAADCKSYIFRFSTIDENLEKEWNNAQVANHNAQQMFEPGNIVMSFLGIFGHENEKTYYSEKQDFFTDVQNISVENVGQYKKILVLTCSDQNNPLGNYNWLKNNKSLGSIEPNAEDRDGLLYLTLTSEEQSGNYTCICKDTSCKPYMHTYQVFATASKKEDPSYLSNLISNQTQTKNSISWTNVIDTNWWYSIWFRLRSFVRMIED